MDTMLNECFKRYALIQHMLCALYLCVLLSVLGVLSAPVAHADSRCADLIPNSSKEQIASIDFGPGSEPTPSRRNVLFLSSSSSGSALGSSSGSTALDFYSNFFNFSDSKNPIELTKNFQSYIGELLEKQIIGEPQLIRFIEHLEKGKLINLISEDEALTSTSLLVQRRGLQKYLNKTSLDQKELLDWSKATLAKRARVRVSREEIQEETRYQSLEFHPVKRPVHFTMALGVGENLPITLTHSIEVQSTPVTQKQWVEVMGENSSYFAKGEDSVILNFHGKDIKLQPDNPVENVTWWSVLEFANRLSEQHGLSPAYDLSHITWDPDTRPENGTLQPVEQNRGSYRARVYVKGKRHDPYEGDIYYQAEGYRLPTLAEQVYMLQGGEKGRHPNEADLQDYAWYRGNSGGRTHPVGLLQPMMIDGKDFYDLYGNVGEWVWDKPGVGLKGYMRKRNPVGPKEVMGLLGRRRRAVGGGFSYIRGGFVSPFSTYADLAPRQGANVGFRLVRTIETGDGE